MLIEKEILNEFLDEEIAQIEALKEEMFKEEKSSNKLIGAFLQFVLESKGKSLRPKLTILCSNLFGKPNKSTYLAAILLEILHQATLLHDDVVDEATERRGEVSANIKFGNKSCVLMGDYLLSRMIESSAKAKEFKLLEILSTTLVALSKGELIQMNADVEAHVSSDHLLEIAKMKTGSLIKATCLSGAYATGASDKDIAHLNEFGELFGVAYQIKDDLLDYNETNKEIFKDLKEHKINIPFALAIENSTKEAVDELMIIFDKTDKTEEDFKSIYTFIKSNNGVEEAQKLYETHINSAISVLDYIQSDNKGYLIDFIEAFKTRTY